MVSTEVYKISSAYLFNANFGEITILSFSIPTISKLMMSLILKKSSNLFNAFTF